MESKKAIIYAFLAAVLYSLMTPVSKLMLIDVPPVMEAGLLYLGAGIGMTAVYLIERLKKISQSYPSVGKGDLKYIIAMVILDMLAPIFLLLGLSKSTPENVSLLNNFEIVATTIIAAMFFHEKIGKKLIISIGLITLSCLLLSFDGSDALRFSSGSLYVLLACVCWGFENNCTSSLSDKDTRQIVIIKGLGSGTASLICSFVINEGSCTFTNALTVMILGFLAVGLSVYFYVKAQSQIGAARTSSYYAVSPFIGVLLSLLIFQEIPGAVFWIALLVMAAGVWLDVKDTLNG